MAERSGVGRTTLHRHWPDTPALVRATPAHHIAVSHTEPTGHLRTDLVAELEAGRAMLHEAATDRAIRVVLERAAVDPVFVDDTVFVLGLHGQVFLALVLLVALLAAVAGASGNARVHT